MSGPPEPLRRNDTSFPVQVSARLRELYQTYLELRASDSGEGEATIAAALKYYQFLVRRVMMDPEYGIGEDGNGRGLLIYHTMGMGKTFLAVSTAMALWDNAPPLVLAPKSLHKNFRETVDKYVALTNPGLAGSELEARQAEAAARFRFASLDAHNMATQIAKLTSGSEAAGALNDRLLIVDEAHNLFRAIINSPDEKTNARRLYNMVMAARNLRVLFLTGTVPSKDPFELVPCFNMLAGYELLPTQYERFYKYYVDTGAGLIRNRGRLANRLLGLVSHATHSLPSEPGSAGIGSDAFPRELPTVIERVEMSPDQYQRYLLIREKEEKESGSVARPGANFSRAALPTPNTPALSLPGAESDGGSTYYVKSRAHGNFAPPVDEADLGVAEMSDGAFTAESSPKITRLLDNLAKSAGPAIVYSQFVDVGGLAAVGRFLEKAGYRRYEVGRPSVKSGGETYAVISGDVRPEDRILIQERFNSRDNAHGEIIKVLLVSKTGAEGLDLKGVRQVHILEPYWDKSREDQVKARGVRLGSHTHLPDEEREVQPFLYIASENRRLFEGMRPTDAEEKAPPRRYRLIEEQTIDERFHQRALKKQALNSAFRELLSEVSLECAVNGYGNCRMCVPTDAPLFHENAARDLRLPDACRPLEAAEVTVKEIRLPGADASADDAGDNATRFFYREDPESPFGVTFFDYDDELEAYTPVDPSTGLALRLLRVYESLDTQ